MRHTTQKHEETKTAVNPALLYQKDLQAFAAVKEYRQALRTAQTAKAQNIVEANLDLLPYFNFVNQAIRKNPYYEV